MWQGCGTALVTPFDAQGRVDETRLRALVRRQIAQGIDFLVPCGTTGESPTLTHEEHLRVVQVTVEEAAGRVPVMGGAGGYNTAEVIALGQELAQIGVDALLSVAPYYNKPTQEGLYQHYKAIAAETGKPVLVYNVPGRCGVNIEPSTILRLAEVPGIIGVKEASGNIAQMATIAGRMPAGFLLFSGDDAITLPVIALGGVGVVSVASNVVPGEMAQLARTALNGDWAGARAIQRRLLPLLEVNFVESNPIPVKYALSLMGLIEANYRLPLVPPADASQQKIAAVLQQLALTEGQPVHA